MKDILKNWHLGVTFGFRAKNGWFSSEEAKAEARAIKESGADWVVLVVTSIRSTPIRLNSLKILL